MPRNEAPFSSLDEPSLRALAPLGVARNFPKNAIVVNEGDDTDSLYVLLSGRVKAFVTGEDGREVVVNTIGVGDYFGELVLDGGPRAASIMTLEPCRMFIIPCSDVKGLLAARPEFAEDLITKLIGKVRSLTSTVRDLAIKDNYGRLVRFLTDHAIASDGVMVVPERLTQHEIAARIGGSRETVNRLIRDLVAGGYISVDARQIRILRKLPSHW